MPASTPSTPPPDSFLPAALLRDAGTVISRDQLIPAGDRVLAMVSGGADSVLMLHVLARLARVEEPALAGRFTLGVCHVNYGRRGAASDGDEAFVRALAKRLGIAVHTLRAPRRDAGNFQAWARDFRYQAARDLCRRCGYTRVAVGHNRDDRVETMIYRMITYSGRRSLVVMPPRRGPIVRPLLFLAAEDVRGTCRGAGLEYREDESNSGSGYSRNRIRHEVMPRLAGIRPDFHQRMLDTMAQLEDEEAVLAAVTDAAWEQAAVAGEDGAAVLLAPQLARLERATARLVARRWLAASGARVRLSRRLLDEIVDLCQNSDGSRGVTLAPDLRAEREYDKLVLVAGASPAGFSADGAAGSSGRETLEPVSLPVPGKAVFGGYELEAVRSPAWDVASADAWRATVDAAQLPGPLQVRAWQPGDRFRPLGLKGSKSLQDQFVDAKVPRRQRRSVPVVVSGGKIVWVGGLRIAEDFRVTRRSEHLMGLRATRRSVDNKV